MTTRRSGRRRCTFFRRPNRRSVSSDRSCASSTITTPYLVSRGSSMSSRSRTPSVQNCSLVTPGVETHSKRTAYPTSAPRGTPISSATRIATVCAATRRGCVHATRRPPAHQPASARYCGTCVVFPHPVWPTSTTVARVSTRYRIASRHRKMGRRRRCVASARPSSRLYTSRRPESPTPPRSTSALRGYEPEGRASPGFQNAIATNRREIRENRDATIERTPERTRERERINAREGRAAARACRRREDASRRSEDARTRGARDSRGGSRRFRQTKRPRAAADEPGDDSLALL